MAKFIIRYNNGYGDEVEVIVAENLERANQYAYEAARENWKNNADYESISYSKEMAEDYGVEEEVEDDT